jgi:hypothetical protein
MKKYEFTAKSNPYYRTLEGLGLTQLTNIFDTVSYNNKILPQRLTVGLEEVSYFNLLLGYGATPTPTTDLFEFFEEKDLFQLRYNKNTILVFDCTFEGLSKNDLLIAQALDYSCIKHQINRRKIFLFTGNLKTLEHNTGITVIPSFILHLSFEKTKLNSITLNDAKERCGQNLKNIVLSLSRRPRIHRVLAHFMLANSEIFEDCIVSQCLCEPGVDSMFGGHISQHDMDRTGLTYQDWDIFRSKLPLIADGNYFHINEPFDHLTDLHASTVFSIVNETLADNYNDTSLFYSEKFLKPIINFQPMVIYGQRGINKQMSLLGFKTYESYFNLDFDDEPDDVYRYKKLLLSITDTVKYLKSLTRDQQIEWRFHQTELLEYNFLNVMYIQHVEDSMAKFLLLVRQLTDNL